jgi:hypothetical protein
MIPTGRHDVPTTAAEFASALRSGIRSALRADREPVVDVTPELVSVDLSGLRAEAETLAAPTGARTQQTDVVRRLLVQGDPVYAFGAPVRLRLDAQAVPVAWRSDAAGQLWLHLDDRSSELAGTLDASVRIEDLRQMVAALIERQLAPTGFALKQLDLRVWARGERGIALEAEAKVGRSFLSARVTATGQASIDDSLVATLEQAQLTSANPVVGAFLRPMNDEIAPLVGRPFDLRGEVLAGAGLRDVTVTVDDSIHVHAVVGG